MDILGDVSLIYMKPDRLYIHNARAHTDSFMAWPFALRFGVHCWRIYGLAFTPENILCNIIDFLISNAILTSVWRQRSHIRHQRFSWWYTSVKCLAYTPITGNRVVFVYFWPCMIIICYRCHLTWHVCQCLNLLMPTKAYQKTNFIHQSKKKSIKPQWCPI